MKNLIITLSWFAMFAGLSGCVNSTHTHEQDRAQHQTYLEHIYTTYDPEYIDDCFEHSELVCEFE